MTLRLRLRLLISAIVGALLVVTVGSALQFRDVATAMEILLGSLEDGEVRDTADMVRNEAATAAIGLGILGAVVLLAGAWISRTIRVVVLDRLEAIEEAAKAIRRGESTRRVGSDGDDELGRVAAAIDYVLDLRNTTESAMHGRNSELRALLVALLQNWPRQAAVTGLDGEIIVSTLALEQEGALRSVTPQLRAAARILLSRKFVSAAELTTDLRVDETHAFAIKALALGEQRIVGWIAEFAPAGVQGGNTP
jgi:HAMP domain-containing protein